MSRSSSSSSSSPQTTTLNLGLQDTEGSVAAVDSQVSITTTDQGSVNAAREIAVEAIGASERNFDVLADSIARSGETVARVSESAIDTVSRSSRDAFDFAGDVHRTSLDVVDSATARSLTLASDATREIRAAYEGAGAIVERAGAEFVSAVSAFQARESSNTDSRFENVTRTALIGAGVVAAGALYLALSK